MYQYNFKFEAVNLDGSNVKIRFFDYNDNINEYLMTEKAPGKGFN